MLMLCSHYGIIHEYVVEFWYIRLGMYAASQLIPEFLLRGNY